jgi:hypothetical protein
MTIPSDIQRCREYIDLFLDEFKSDKPTLEQPVGMLQELAYLVDDLEGIHIYLDSHDVPRTDSVGDEMSIARRIANLLGRLNVRSNQPLDFYCKPGD